MIAVEEAQRLCLGLAGMVGTEEVALAAAAGRVLTVSVQAGRAQPPFRSAAMDGYAVKDSEVAIGASFTVVGESAAGHGWDGTLQAGQAVRIFTGAPVPEGADHVVIQEDVARDGDTISIQPNLGDGPNIRPEGVDFPSDFTLKAPRQLSAIDLALLAAMNVDRVTVAKRPVVDILATGDELVMPGEVPTRDQIIASNLFAIKALVKQAGGIAHIHPIAADTEEAITAAMKAMTGDIAITIGGASVGDYDLVGKVSDALGVERSFYKISMRPGKPLIAGRFPHGAPYLGLPGNPVSAIVCALLFLIPLVKRMQGLEDVFPATRTARLAHDTPKNGPRTHYMRATLTGEEVTIAGSQDSSLLTVMAEANCLVIRPIGDEARRKGEVVEIVPL